MYFCVADKHLVAHEILSMLKLINIGKAFGIRCCEYTINVIYLYGDGETRGDFSSSGVDEGKMCDVRSLMFMYLVVVLLIFIENYMYLIWFRCIFSPHKID